jgi:hypothetical protein
MKKVFLFFAIAMVFASCAPKATEEAAPVEEAVVTDSVAPVDSAAVVADSAAVVAQ